MSIQITENVPLASLTTFKIGGNAKYYASIKDDADLVEALAWAAKNDQQFLVLSGGSNVLVSDAGFDGLVMHMESSHIETDGTALVADAGCNLLALIRTAAVKGLGGWEKLAGIPGTIGGAVRGNAGAFGDEIKDFATRVEALNSATGEKRTFENSQMDFSYRHSFFKDHPEWIITKIYLKLPQVKPAESGELIEKTIAEREKRHLQNVKAAGSFFMNPTAPQNVVEMFEAEKSVKARENRVPAGWLIEKAGMKGKSVGGAQASEQHPNYIVNTGTATAEDVRKLSAEIKRAVQAMFGVVLTEEAALV